MFEFREVEASPSKPSREAGAQTKQSMLNTKSADASADSGGQKSADNIGNQLVAKLKCEKQKSVEKAAKELDDLDDRELELEFESGRSSACDCPAHVHNRESPLLIAQDGFSTAFDPPPLPLETGTPRIDAYYNYSYGCLVKKWSL